MWVWGYRKNQLLVNINTNNGIERQNKTFKYSYLAQRKITSLSGMLETWWNAWYLVSRPHPLVGHALWKIEQAKRSDLTGIVIVERRGKLLVTSFTQESNKSRIRNEFRGWRRDTSLYMPWLEKIFVSVQTLLCHFQEVLWKSRRGKSNIIHRVNFLGRYASPESTSK